MKDHLRGNARGPIDVIQILDGTSKLLELSFSAETFHTH